MAIFYFDYKNLDCIALKILTFFLYIYEKENILLLYNHWTDKIFCLFLFQNKQFYLFSFCLKI